MRLGAVSFNKRQSTTINFTLRLQEAPSLNPKGFYPHAKSAKGAKD